MQLHALWLGGWLVPSLFLCPLALADTLEMKDGTQKMGLIVEQHEDRVIINTEEGEIPVLRDAIGKIVFDDAEQTFLELGESNEREKRWGEALAYYEKALEVNPDFEEAKKASARVRNHFRSKAATGPNTEVEKRQALYDSWGKPTAGEEGIKDRARQAELSLKNGLGLTLAQQGDWVAVMQAEGKKDAARYGLKKGDRLVALDGRSLRYLSADVARQKFLTPRFSSFTLEYERDLKMRRTGFERGPEEFGLQVTLDSRGTVVKRVKKGSAAEHAGVKEGDLLVSANGTSMRYLPLKKLLSVLIAGTEDTSVLSVRRAVMLERK